MEPTATPVDATLGATITGVDLANLDDAAWRFVEDAFLEYALLIFPGQDLSANEQVAFSNRFGDIEILRENAKSVPISNQKPDGSVLNPDEYRFKTLRGNEGWHLDSTYMPIAAKAGVLTAKVVPSRGGETELADMRAAYEALDDAMKERIQGLSAYHSLYASQAKIGHIVDPGSGYGYHTKGAPLRPLVKTHPVTGRKSLCLGRHVFRIPGMADEEAVSLVDDLIEFACEPPRTYAHNWTPGDLIIWDNRCVMHRARPYDFSEARVMQATRIAGEASSELAPTVADERAGAFEPATTNR
jgi:alpha-ketoglutarate-dependent taurine dioxygenase